MSGGDYKPFEGICLTDTFQLYEQERDLISDLMADSFGDTMAYYNAKTSPSSTNGGLLYQPIGASTKNQRIYGFEGNDEIRGNDGIDTLIGGLGNDLLYGGGGSDMYVYTNLDGLDRITESSGDDDAIFFSNELRPADLRVIRITDTNDLQLHFGDSSTGIILTNQVSMGNSAVERFSFVGVQPLDAGDVATIYLRSLTSEKRDVVSGTAAGESIYGLSGSDTLSGLDGDDTIFGGDE